jgi:hypothetical protein
VSHPVLAGIEEQQCLELSTHRGGQARLHRDLIRHPHLAPVRRRIFQHNVARVLVELSVTPSDASCPGTGADVEHNLAPASAKITI